MVNRRDRAYNACVDYMNQILSILLDSYSCPRVSDGDMEYVMSLLQIYRQSLIDTFTAMKTRNEPCALQDMYNKDLYSQSDLIHMSETSRLAVAGKTGCYIGGDQYDQERRDESKNGAETGEDET